MEGRPLQKKHLCLKNRKIVSIVAKTQKLKLNSKEQNYEPHSQKESKQSVINSMFVRNKKPGSTIPANYVNQSL